MTRRIYIYLLLLCLLLAACEEEEYVYPSVLTEFIDIQTDSSGTITHLLTDKGERYAVQPREGLDGLRADTTYRTISIYRFVNETTDLAELEVMLYSSQSVIASYPSKLSEWEDSIHTDPVDIQSIWLSGNYLNLILDVRRKDQTHVFYFIEDSLSAENAGTHTLYLRLYHNSNNDYEAFTDQTYLSVPLRHYRDSLHAGDKIRFRLNTYKEGETYRDFIVN